MAEIQIENDVKDLNITKDDFKLVQADKEIHDEKLQTKPTTYLKDALKRFKKNKSSVAGAIVLGILVLLAIFVPIFSGNDIDNPRINERFLAPKLFASGTGFWDGTKDYVHIIYDTDNETPADFYKPAVTNLVIESNPSYINTANKYGKGGYFQFVNENENSSTSDLTATKKLYSYATSFTSVGNYKVEIHLFDEDNINNCEQQMYRIYLSYTENAETKEILLKDWSTEYNSFTLDISKAMSTSGVEKIDSGRLTFELKAGEMKKSYLLIEKCIFTADSSVENYDSLDTISILDSTKSILLTRDEETKKFPVGYWQCTGVKNIYKSMVYYCSFTYDTYAGAFDVIEKVIAMSTLQDYVRKGYCKYNSSIGPTSFEKLSDECPIESISAQNSSSIGVVTSVTAQVCRYKEAGYKSMPVFLFGTDAQGHDIVKKAFAGLRTSLVLGLCTGLFCLAFGLCWGAISGYFGGNVDLVMERFCDILGGVPFIVMITLCILHLGNNFFVFFLALCLTGWMGVAARTRTQFYRFKGREYVLASRTLGASDGRLIFRHILPNALGTIVTSSVLMIPSVIFSEATLAYLNLGLQGTNSFGVMLSDNQVYISTYPNLIVFPSVIMALIMISFNLFGNGLRDALNPSLKGSE